MFFNSIKKIHFIGIGGIGMSGIAEILNEKKFQVTGSDINENNNTKRLRNLGIKILIGHKKQNIRDAQIVVFSSAIKKNNIEMNEARKLKLPIIPRAAMLAEILRFKSAITVSGSHGKTTTTSIIASIFESSKLDPTIINGGIINKYDTNAKLGKGDWIIAEADESDGSFTVLPSVISIINNIDAEHMEYYGNFQNLKKAFVKYAQNIPFYGFISVHIDDKNIKKVIKQLPEKRIFKYGVSSDANVTYKNLKFFSKGKKIFSKFDVSTNFGKIETIKNIYLPLVGYHNVFNALAAISVAIGVGINKNDIKKGLKKFEGVNRRTTIIYNKNNIRVFDDYAHHPKEITCTIDSIKLITKGKVIIIHQPHRYSRLNFLFREFTHCFNNSDYLFLMPVYSAGEKKIKNVDSMILSKKIKNCVTSFEANEKKIFKDIKKLVSPGDSIAFLGAGSITTTAKNFAQYLSNREEK